MFDYDSRLELAPRDVVARSIAREMQALDTWCVYLDATHLPSETLQHEFPTIWQKLSEIGILMDRDWIPVVPAQHYSCGGVVTDLDGKTNVPGLYASGEVACTGVHGANRLASNSLLEAIVFSFKAAEVVVNEPVDIPAVHEPKSPLCLPESEAIQLRHALQKLMSAHAGIFRTTAGLQEASDKIATALTQYDGHATAPFGSYSAETRNLLINAQLIVNGALSRTANVGLHFNADLAE